MGGPAARKDWVLKAWSSRALLSLSFGPLRLVPAPAEFTPTGALADRLRPFRRRLWRRRALLLLLRSGMLALGWLLAANLAALAWWPDLPLEARTVPGLLLLLCGCWLILAQRPTLQETARMLDRRFQLHDQMGTAIEVSAGAEAGALASRQLARAIAALDALPREAWSTSLLAGPERLIAPALAVGVALSALASPARHTPPMAQATSGTVPQRAHSPSGARGVAPRGLLVRTGSAATPHQRVLPARSRALPVGPATTFAASFQVRADTQASGSSGTLAMAGAPGQPLTVPSGGTAPARPMGAQTGGVSGAAAHGSQATHQGADAPSSRGQQPGQQAGRGQGGSGTQQGTAGAQVGPSGQQAGTLGTPEPGAATGSPSGSGQAGRNGRGNRGPQSAGSQAPANGAGAPGAVNPFGQVGNPAQAGTHGAGSQGSGSGRQARTGSARPSAGATRQATGRARQNSAGSQAGDPEQGPSRRRGAATGPQPASPIPAPRRANSATGPEIDIGGQVQLGGDGSGPQIMRIEPLTAGSAPTQGGALSSGSSLVQGYVPRDDSTIAPADQAVIRAYFSQGSGS